MLKRISRILRLILPLIMQSLISSQVDESVILENSTSSPSRNRVNFSEIDKNINI